jgi:hypothetical protein
LAAGLVWWCNSPWCLAHEQGELCVLLAVIAHSDVCDLCQWWCCAGGGAMLVVVLCWWWCCAGGGAVLVVVLVD